MKKLELKTLILFVVLSCNPTADFKKESTTNITSGQVADPQPLSLVLDDGSYKFSDDSTSRSCLSYLNSAVYTNQGDGLYWLDHDNDNLTAPIKAYCDMTRNGGGWTLVASRRGANSNSESCGANLSEFFNASCGDVTNINYSDSYSLGDGSSRESIISSGEWMFLSFDVTNTLDSDDAFIIKNNGSDLFFVSTDTVNTTSVDSICDIDNQNCDITDTFFLWVGNTRFGGSNCRGIFQASAFLGMYGYCHDGVGPNYSSNSLFGNRDGLNETKLWDRPTSSQDFQEKIFVR